MARDARTRHTDLMRAYRGDEQSLGLIKSDVQVLKENYRFLLEDDELKGAGWEMRMVKAYHDQLFKEYCLADLSRIDEANSPIGLRWRTEAEVVDGRGQFTCGSLHCREEGGLQSWELPFGYTEQGVKKVALVKVRLCELCSAKLPSSKRKEPVKSSTELLP